MTSLVVVGMRYTEFKHIHKLTKGSKLYLRPEPGNDFNSKALAAYFKNSDNIYEHVGYIRDTDLKLADGLGCYNKGIKSELIIKVVSQNYIVGDYEGTLRDQSRATVESAHGITRDDLSPDGACYLNARVITSGLVGVSPASLSSPITFSSASSPITLKEPKMNTTAIKDSFFREVKNVAFDLQSGKLGIKSKDGITVYSSEGISVNPITEMGFDMPAFAMRVPVADLKEGDILIGNGEPVFFKEFFVDKGQTTGYKAVSLNGTIQEVGVVTNMFFGKNTVLAVKNMFGDASGGMNPMLMLAMSGMLGGDSKIDPLMLMMMSGGMGGSDGMNPMMMALMLSKK